MPLAEQNAKLALEVSQRGYVMESGLITLTAASAAFINDPQARRAYLGEWGDRAENLRDRRSKLLRLALDRKSRKAAHQFGDARMPSGCSTASSASGRHIEHRDRGQTRFHKTLQ